MDNQISYQTQCSNNFVVFLLAPDSSKSVTAFDLSYEIEDAELANELVAQTGKRGRPHAEPLVSPKDFETVYKWFIA